MKTLNDTLANYCFLAALTENQNDLYNHVYVPICKRALSLYSLIVASQGTVQDIQEIIKQEYGIDVPVLIVRKLIESVFSSLSRRKKTELGAQCFEHGNSFQLTQYSFTELEAKYKKGLRNASKLELAFNTYLATEQIDSSKLPSLTDFLDRNKCQIASFFRGNGVIKRDDIEHSFIYHVQFLEYLNTSDDELFQIAEQLYLGTIVAGFLESGINVETNFASNEVYYIDTPLILRALDLQKEEETKPALELLNLIRNTGGTIKVLSVTLNELSEVISNAVAAALKKYNESKANKNLGQSEPTRQEQPNVGINNESNLVNQNSPISDIPEVSFPNVTVPNTDIIDSSNTTETIASNMSQNIKPVTNQASFAQIVKMLRECADKIEQSGYFVNVDELDLGNQYKVTFTIDKE